MASRRNVLFLFGIVLAALLLDGITTYRNLLRWSEDNQWVVHTQKVIIAIEEARSLFRFAVNRYQNYLLSGNKSDIPNLESLIGQRRQSLDSIQILTADNPDQQKRVGEIRTLAADQDEIYQKSLKAWKEGKTNHRQEVI